MVCLVVLPCCRVPFSVVVYGYPKFVQSLGLAKVTASCRWHQLWLGRESDLLLVPAAYRVMACLKLHTFTVGLVHRIQTSERPLLGPGSTSGCTKLVTEVPCGHQGHHSR